MNFTPERLLALRATFSEQELRLLMLGDRAGVGPGPGSEKGVRKVRGMLGALTEAEALRLYAEGASTNDLAEKAGVLPRRVSTWKAQHGIARPKKRPGQR